MNGYNEFLSSDEVIYIVSNLTVDDQAFLVGGQAASLWAEYYVQFEPELSQYEPFTTKDVDYFGGVKAAEKLAAAINGKVVLPSKDTMNSNSTALVEASVNDRTVVIDFLHDIIGVNRKEFEKGVATILLKTEKGQTIEIPLMHPVLCLKSRLGNMLSAATMRRDEVATRQAHAAVLVVKAYIEEALPDNDVKEAMRCLFDVLHYVNSDMYGRNAHVDPGIDALTIVKAFADVSSWRTATCDNERLARPPPLCEQFLPEDFCWRFIAKAFARCCIQSVADFR